MPTTSRPGVRTKPKGTRVKKVRPLSPGEFRDLLQGTTRERSYWEKSLLWIGAKLIAAGLTCYRLTD